MTFRGGGGRGKCVSERTVAAEKERTKKGEIRVHVRRVRVGSEGDDATRRKIATFISRGIL